MIVNKTRIKELTKKEFHYKRRVSKMICMNSVESQACIQLSNSIGNYRGW